MKKKNQNENISMMDNACYLTSACIYHFKSIFDENCYPLKVINQFKNSSLSEEDVIHYNEVAPLIVGSINESPDKEDIYETIYREVVMYCTNCILRGNPVGAYQKLKESFAALESKYVKQEDTMILSLKNKD